MQRLEIYDSNDKILNLVEFRFNPKTNSLELSNSITNNQIYLNDPELINLFQKIKSKMLSEPDKPPFKEKSGNSINMININFTNTPGKKIRQLLCRFFHPDAILNNKNLSEFDKKRSTDYMKAAGQIDENNIFELKKLVSEWNNSKERPSFLDKK